VRSIGGDCNGRVQKLKVRWQKLRQRRDGRGARPYTSTSSSAQFAQEFLLVHAVFKSFAAVDEDYGDLVVIEAPDFGVGVYIDFTPGEAAPLVELDDALFDDFAEMTSLAGINDDFARLRHARECISLGAGFPRHGGA